MNAVVIDNGSGMCKAGIAGKNAPQVSFPSIVGRPKYQKIGIKNDKQLYVGQEAIAFKGMLKLSNPIEHGIINNWEQMQHIWNYCYYTQLRTTPSEHPCMLTEAPRNPKKNRQKMTQIMFEQFQVPYFYLSIQAILTLYSSGKTTGLVIDSGDGVTHTVPIFQGYSMPHAIQRNNFAGRDLTSNLQKLLTQIGCNFQSSAEMEIVKQIKQKLCYVAQDYDEQIKKYQNNNKQMQPFELPDGQIIQIGSQLFRCPQALFKPMGIGKDMLGIHQLGYQSISKCDLDVKKDLYSNIVLSGGNTMFANIEKRINYQLCQLAPSTMKIRIDAPPQRKSSVWIGGSLLSELNSFKNMWISKSQYQQTGVSIIHRKCF